MKADDWRKESRKCAPIAVRYFDFISMCFARLICAQAELQPFEADARAATLNNVLDLGKFHLTVH